MKEGKFSLDRTKYCDLEGLKFIELEMMEVTKDFQILEFIAINK